MQIGVNLGPTANWSALLATARKSDDYGFAALGFLDHYHATRPEWGYVCGWSLYGALAMATRRIKLVPMVICRLNYLPGVLAKETSVLSLLSGGRFELGIGAGDYFEEMHAWSVPVPKAQKRIEGLEETVQLLRQVWKGEVVTFEGQHIHVREGLCVPAPETAPRVVIGVGSSRSLLHSALEYADELNVYADDAFIQEARRSIEASGREITLSTFVWDWRTDIAEKLKAWEQLGVTRTFITFWEPFTQLEQAAQWLK